jgi:hypothetical protein
MNLVEKVTAKKINLTSKMRRFLMMPEAEQIRQFDNTENTPAAWILQADSLLRAARVLKACRDRFDPTRLKVGDTVPDAGVVLFPELMLRGFAVECLMKAHWLKLGNKIAAGGKYLGVKGAADHDLLQLSDVVGVRFSDAARDVLKRLSIIMTSAGRYPTPRDWSTRRIQKIRGGSKGIPEFWSYPSDDRTLESVVEALYEELHK